jgi:Na+-transporting NADH:ubiquinone oxidoreductase subunit B/electron transport complex protein RnfD
MTLTYDSVIKKALDKRNLTIMTIALSVLVLASTIIFGYQVLVVAAVSLVTALLVELMFSKGRKIEFDGAWMIYPLLLTLLIPSTLELRHVWMVAVGSAFGTFFGKGIFGGSGKYVFNPALVGLLFITISFPQYFPTMLVSYSQVGTDYTLVQMLLGNTPGALGETFRLGIIILGIVLILFKVIDWKIPVSIIIGTLIFTYLIVLISDIIEPRYVPSNVLNSLFIGNLILVSFFVAPDETTAPIFPWGRVIYGIGIAFLTVVIRYYATFPEGTMFAIILMSAIAPLIDSMFFARLEKKEGAADESKS